MIRSWFVFPNPVNEKVARSVAALVLITALVTLITASWWLLPVMTVGFALRVAFGPRVSPFAILASRVMAPRMGAAVYVSGPPKRFAQTIGLAVTLGASIAFYGASSVTVAAALTALIALAAALESIFTFCIGCRMFSVLMYFGVIPRSVCLSCANTYVEIG